MHPGKNSANSRQRFKTLYRGAAGSCYRATVRLNQTVGRHYELETRRM